MASTPGIAPFSWEVSPAQRYFPSHLFFLSFFFFSFLLSWPLFLAFFSCHFRVFYLLITWRTTCMLRTPQSVSLQTNYNQQPVPLGHPTGILWVPPFTILCFLLPSFISTHSGIQARDCAASLTLPKPMQSPNSTSWPSLMSLKCLLSFTSPCCCPGWGSLHLI